MRSWEVGRLEVYLHRRGLCRLASAAYDPRALEEPRCHLTNSSINERGCRPSASGAAHSPAGANAGADADVDGGCAPSCTRSLGSFRQHLEAELGASTAAQTWAAIADLVVKTMLAAQPQTVAAMHAALGGGDEAGGGEAGGDEAGGGDDRPGAGRAACTAVPPGCCFELFGFDVLVDARGRPWLLEVNQDPSLSTQTSVDLDVKAEVLVDLLNLVGLEGTPAAASEKPHSALEALREEVGPPGNADWRTTSTSTAASSTTRLGGGDEPEGCGWQLLAVPDLSALPLAGGASCPVQTWCPA